MSGRFPLPFFRLTLSLRGALTRVGETHALSGPSLDHLCCSDVRISRSDKKPEPQMGKRAFWGKRSQLYREYIFYVLAFNEVGEERKNQRRFYYFLFHHAAFFPISIVPTLRLTWGVGGWRGLCCVHVTGNALK